MLQYVVQVQEVSAIGDLVRVRCAGGAGSAAPGQFFLAAPSDSAQLVGWPIFAHTGAAGLEFFAPGHHPAAELAPGESLDLIGPAGRGFRLPARPGRLLVVADKIEHVWPLIFHCLSRAWSLALLPMADESLPWLPPAVEILRGPLTEEAAAWADLVALDVAEPEPAAREARRLCPMRLPDFVQAVQLPVVPCGTGACQACWVPVGGRRRLACVDGPVFSL